jgi:hypothetical protein
MGVIGFFYMVYSYLGAGKFEIETLVDASREFGLEMNVEKTKYMLLSCYLAGQNRDIKIANGFFEYVSHLIYLGSIVTNQNLVQKEIKRRMKFGNACYHSVRNLLSSRLPSNKVKIIVYKTIILPVVLYGCET